jgi:hypothetical protein
VSLIIYIIKITSIYGIKLQDIIIVAFIHTYVSQVLKIAIYILKSVTQIK